MEAQGLSRHEAARMAFDLAMVQMVNSPETYPGMTEEQMRRRRSWLLIGWLAANDVEALRIYAEKRGAQDITEFHETLFEGIKELVGEGVPKDVLVSAVAAMASGEATEQDARITGVALLDAEARAFIKEQAHPASGAVWEMLLFVVGAHLWAPARMVALAKHLDTERASVTLERRRDAYRMAWGFETPPQALEFIRKFLPQGPLNATMILQLMLPPERKAVSA